MAAGNEDLAKAVEGNTPFLATCLRGQNESLGRICLEGLGKALNESDPAKLLAAAADPANVARVKDVEASVKKEMEAITALWTQQCPGESEVSTINIDEYRSLKKMNVWAKTILSVVIVCGFFGIVALQYFGKAGSLVDPSNREQLALLIGALIAAFTAVVQYFFGSSVGSAEKSFMLQNKEKQGGNP